MEAKLRQLQSELEGELFWDSLMKTLYATDGSIYRELPLAVAYPRHEKDIVRLVHFAKANKTSLIPRSAGTSLAGQCVGQGMVVDISRYLNRIIELNEKEQWVLVEPGVIRDELNLFLKPYGLFFGPNTSTANRCMIGGMVGNNSSGTTSIKYGVTRDHVLEMRTVLSDGTTATFGSISKNEFKTKTQGETLENRIYKIIAEELSLPARQEAILREYPKPGIHRRNTGYAVDMLLQSNLFTEGGADFNFCNLLCGSEGTLAFTTAIKLNLSPLPPPEEVLVCAHFLTLDESLRATLVAMRHHPYGCELMDKTILDCTKDNREQQKNRFFLQGDPGAILMIEFRGYSREEAIAQADKMIEDMHAQRLGYAFPKVFPPQTEKVKALRAAGFGVLSNVKGEEKPIEFVEDTAVALEDLPDYIREFDALIRSFGQTAVYYAHAGAGELHTRPAINLKTSEGISKMRKIAEGSAALVKKYGGSLSGEHGDGRVRGEFLKEMVGEDNYEFLKKIKNTWDPDHIFNPGKIVEAPPMDIALRYVQDGPQPAYATLMNFSDTGGILKLAEKCNGSGDCRKLAHVSGGVMCPSYMATRHEKDTTRARANTLREFLTRPGDKKNAFDRKEIKEVLDLCLSCKACATECPSGVDMASMKAEFLYQYYQSNKMPFRAKIFGNIALLNGCASLLPGLSNFIFKNPFTGTVLKKVLGVAKARSLPLVSHQSLRKWYRKNRGKLQPKGTEKGKVYFFCDEFTNYNDAEIGKKAILLLTYLGYKVEMPDHPESGRAAISKGLLKRAQRLARENVKIFKDRVGEGSPLVGVEPSAILGFRDEYPRLVYAEEAVAAHKIGKNALLVEEFLEREIEKGNILPEQFTTAAKRIILHGHCHQKALASVQASAGILSLPVNYIVENIPSGCCGMAGSFGYEKEHFEVSMQIGELILFPMVRHADEQVLIAAPGTSCRHQILDGTGKKTLHPVEILYDALLKPLKIL